MKKVIVLFVVLVVGMGTAQAAMVAQYEFSGNLSDTATGGTAADNLVGMMQYAGNGAFDRAFTNYKTDGTTEVINSCVQAPLYNSAGIVGQAVRIGARGIYNYTGTNTYPNASTYQVPTSGATFLQTTADSVDLSLAGGIFTMEGFFKPDAVGSLGVENSGLGEFAYTRLITKWVSGFNQGYHFTIRNGGLDIIEKNAKGGTVQINGAVTPVADWFYAAAVGDGANLNLYFYKKVGGVVVGGLVASGAYLGTMNDSTDPFYIGGRLDIPNAISSNNGFIGLVDEVRVWDEAKDASYLAGRAAMIPEPATLAILALGGLLIGRKK
jgi:hypothetical protein